MTVIFPRRSAVFDSCKSWNGACRWAYKSSLTAFMAEACQPATKPTSLP